MQENFNMADSMPPKKDYKILIIAGVVLLLVIVVVFFVISGKSRKAEPIVIDNNTEEVEEFVLRDGISPISGLECDNWNRRPMAIMYSGDMDARRNFKALSQADFVLEMPHRPMHNQPRVMGIFQCASPTAMGPMRSGRTDHISVASSLDAIYVPWGGSSVGKNLLKNHEIDHIDCNGEVAPVGGLACRKDNSLLVTTLRSAGAAFSDLSKLVGVAEKSNYRMTSQTKGFHHRSELPREQRADYGLVKIKTDPPYRVYYNYDPETNSYKRNLVKRRGSVPTVDIDQATGEQYAPKNVIGILVKMEAWRTEIDYLGQGVKDPWAGIDAEHKARDDGQYPNFQFGDPWFDTKFEGPARFFINGEDIKGVWKRTKGVDEPFRFYDNKGEPIKFVPGQIWMHVLSHGEHVSYDEEYEEPDVVTTQ